MSKQTAIEHRLLSRPVPAEFPSGTILPDYDGYSICKMASLVEATLGLSPKDNVLHEAIGGPRYDRVLLIILDGLGYRKAQQLFVEQPDSILRQLAATGALVPITSVFPSTTVAALASYSTGLPPRAHGLLGYRLYLREASAITNMIRLSLQGTSEAGTALSAGLSAETLMSEPTVYEKLLHRDVSTHVLIPGHIAGSGLSKVLYRGSGAVTPCASLSDMLVSARRILNQSERRTFVMMYWPGLDSIAHLRGPADDAYRAEAAAVDGAIRRELVGQVGKTLLLVSSDHGFVPMAPSDYLSMADLGAWTSAAVLPPVGEPRASYVYLRNGFPDGQRLPTEVAEGLLAIRSDRAIELGLYGTGDEHAEARSRLGDLQLLSTGKVGLRHPYPDAPLLAGMHGGLTEDEMLVPLIAAAL